MNFTADPSLTEDRADRSRTGRLAHANEVQVSWQSWKSTSRCRWPGPARAHPVPPAPPTPPAPPSRRARSRLAGQGANLCLSVVSLRQFWGIAAPFSRLGRSAANSRPMDSGAGRGRLPTVSDRHRCIGCGQHQPVNCTTSCNEPSANLKLGYENGRASNGCTNGHER